VIRALISLALLSAPALAEDLADPAPLNPLVIEQCLATGLAETCIGLWAGVCETAEGPGSQGLCRGAETAYWQRRAEAAAARLQAGEGPVQARARRLGWPEPIPSLEAVAQGFDAYRRAACDWRAAAWDGIHAGYEQQDCLMRLTARHALLLEGMLGD